LQGRAYRSIEKSTDRTKEMKSTLEPINTGRRGEKKEDMNI
jgi:hypothetical protein